MSDFDVPGVLTAAEIDGTVDAIARVQLPDGNIPWTPGQHTDPWNLIEAAMALDVGGRNDEAEAAYEWLANKQHSEGCWHQYYLGDAIEDATLDTNVACYIANGVWHHYLNTGDTKFLRRFFPVVETAIDYALGFQNETGEIAWRGDDPADGALLTGSSSIHSSIRSAIAIAERLGHERPDWELSHPSLAVAIAHRPEAFLDKGRWAMDWYYPILGGVLRGHAAHARIAAYWRTFVVEGRGVRCVSDRPWITAAETCELVMALDAIGADAEARQLFRWIQFLRDPETDGYWTGMNFDNEAFDAEGLVYPPEQPTWNMAAVVLAADALAGGGPTSGLFRGEGIPVGLTPEELIAAGSEIEAARATRD